MVRSFVREEAGVTAFSAAQVGYLLTAKISAMKTVPVHIYGPNPTHNPPATPPHAQQESENSG